MDSPHFLIVGAGAIGASLAGALAGRCALTIADSDPGVRAYFESQGVQAIAPDALGAAHADLAIVATRSHLLNSIVAALPLFMPVLCIANGINFHCAQARSAVDAPVLFGCVDFSATIIAPGQPKLTQRGGITLPSSHIATRALATLLSGSSIKPRLVDDAVGAIWSKVALNASLDPAAALSNRTIGGAFGYRPAFLLIRRLLREAIEVAQAGNIVLNPIHGTRHTTMDRAFHTPVINRIAAAAAARRARDVQSTMQADLRAGRTTEVESLNAAIAAHADRLQRPDLAPTHRRIAALIRSLAANPRAITDADLAC